MIQKPNSMIDCCLSFLFPFPKNRTDSGWWTDGTFSTLQSHVTTKVALIFNFFFSYGFG